MIAVSRLGLAAALMVLPLAPALATPEVGKPAPAFTGTDSTGKRHSLADFKGKTVVLEWTNAQCPFVVKHYDTNNMQTLQREATKAGVVWLTINSGAPGKQGHLSPEGVNAKRQAKGFASTAYLIDESGAIGRAYEAKTTPHMFVINPAGTLVYMGAIDSDRSSNKERVAGATNHVRDALAAVAANKPVATPVTQPYGCSVKYGG